MSLIQHLYNEAIQREIIEPGTKIDLATAFALVRDMPYQRASDRQPETIISEWRGTCSGKHYTLKALIAELGYSSELIACTCVEDIDESLLTPELHPLWLAANGKLVDVHNYLMLDLPTGKMIVDATWPLGSQEHGLKVNTSFKLGQDQQISCPPLKKWVVPQNIEPQAFKEKLLRENFSPAELIFRDAFIQALGDWLSR
jgi:hypothetical protein